MNIEILKNPRKFVQKRAREVVWKYVLYYGGLMVLLLVALFGLGFTDLLGGPYAAFEVLFWIVLVGVISFTLFLFLIYRKIKKWRHKMTNVFRRRSARHADVVEVKYISNKESSEED
jgi:hypothetical protein